jgi:CHAD domain-containing protein
LDKDNYKAMLPEVLQDDIEPLFAMLQKQRAKALKDVVKGLNSKEYQKILGDWERFLEEDTPESDSAPNAGRPIVDLARERIYKRYRRIVKDGKKILANTEDELLHALRIECKKLRYLLEFFSTLFPAKKINLLIKQLKVLQNNLGDFNDLSVQGEYLLNAATNLPPSNPTTQKVTLAIGALVGTLDNKRNQVKEKFAETFLEFSAPANKVLFKQLFAPHKENK